MEMSAHMSTSHLYIRIRLFFRGLIHNTHLLSISMCRAHTGYHFLRAAEALDVLYPWYREVMLSISTDREKNITGRINGVATRFECVEKTVCFSSLVWPVPT